MERAGKGCLHVSLDFLSFLHILRNIRTFKSQYLAFSLSLNMNSSYDDPSMPLCSSPRTKPYLEACRLTSA